MRRWRISWKTVAIVAAVFVCALAVWIWRDPMVLVRAEFARQRWSAGLSLHQAEVAGHRWAYVEREAKDLPLYSTLVEAHGRYRVAQLEVRRLRDDVLPRLARAEAAAERAYRAGAISYLEWAQLQSERTAARKQQLDVALDAQRALIEIQRLTGQAFVADPATEQGSTP